MLLALVLAATTLLASESGLPAAAEPSFRVIVHRSNPATSISRDQLSAVFMKKLTQWRHGVDVVPADHSPKSDIRERFSRAVHGKTTGYVIRYWHRLIFAGRGIPPKEVDSDEAAIDFVRSHRGAISYVGRDTPLPADVKTIEVTR
jgi:ABC-type phosphate transport system substrate-binding protein